MMTNKYNNKIFKKAGVMGISEVGLPKIDVGLTKSYIKSCIRRVGGTRVESRKSRSKIKNGGDGDIRDGGGVGGSAGEWGGGGGGGGGIKYH